MNAFELFAGIGGIALAEQMAGINVVALSEMAEFPTRVLQKNFPGIPILPDVTKINADQLRKVGVDPGAIDIISGGFPCQPFSSAGKRKGTEDDRDLWPEMFRIIQEIRPTWIVGENVANFANMELDRTLNDLESSGYQARAFVLPAAAVGALHQRQRTFIVANTIGKRCTGMEIYEKSRCSELDNQSYDNQAWHQTWSEKEHLLSAGSRIVKNKVGRIHRIDDGLPTELDRLKALGNAVVPQQILPIFKAIIEIDELTEE